jgi:hypothetical protein
MSAPGESASSARGASRSTSRGARSAIGLGALALAAASDVEPEQHSAPCWAADIGVQVFASSRLFDAPNDRLELLAGRALDCADPTARQVLAAIEGALQGASRPALVRALQASAAARAGTPLRIHLDPRLPPRQAPLAGIEVQVSRRELLVAASALNDLGPEVWRHELLHAIAATPPEASRVARHLWLTVEEGLVAHVAQLATDVRRDARPSAAPRLEPSRFEPGAPPPSGALSRRLLPASALLASPAYDPHPLAAGLVRELASEARIPVDAWLDCLSASPSALPADAASSDVFRAFVERGSAEAARALSAAIGRWWVDAAQPADRVASERRNATARAGESR